MRQECSGYRCVSEADLPPAWLSWLREQTLAESTEDQAVFTLLWRSLPETPPPTLGQTWLELAAWCLIARPEVNAVVWPLYADLDPDRPRSLTGCDARVLEQLCEGGYLMLLADVGPSGAPTPAMAHHRDPRRLLVATRALIESRHRISVSLARRGWRGWSRALLDFGRRHLSVRQKDWLKDQLRRLGRLPRPGPRAPEPAAPPLARCRHWSPAIDHPRIALRPMAPRAPIPILFALHWLELGGAEKFALDLARALPKDRYAVHVTTEVPSDNPWAETLRGHVEAIIHLPEHLPDHAVGIFYEHYIRSRQIRLMHIHHGPRAYESLFHIRRLQPGVRILDTLHILELPPHSGGYPEHMACHYSVFLDAHHVVSQHLADFLTERWLMPAERVQVAHLNVDCDWMDPRRVEPGQYRAGANLASEALVIGFVGRFTRQKRPLAFVDMAERLSKRWQDMHQSIPLHFFMAGSGVLEAEVRARRAASPELAATLHLVGELVDVRPFYRDCDLIAMPSENEGLALVAYEAMAMGLPVIFTDVGAQHELLPPECLVPPDGAVGEALVDAVWPLLIDTEQRLALGRRNRAYVVEHHQVGDTFAKMLDLYRRLLAESAV